MRGKSYRFGLELLASHFLVEGKWICMSTRGGSKVLLSGLERCGRSINGLGRWSVILLGIVR